MMGEADEFYIKAGLKGRPYNKDIMNSGRLLRHGGLNDGRTEVHLIKTTR